MTEAPNVERLPDLVRRKTVTVAGLSGHFTPQSAQIPQLWAKLFDTLAERGMADPAETYGITWDMDGGSFKYSAAISLPPDGAIPDGFEELVIPEGAYLVSRITTAAGDLSAQFMSAMGRIWGEILPASGLKPAGGPPFELYRKGFQPGQPGQTIDFYIPVQA